MWLPTRTRGVFGGSTQVAQNLLASKLNQRLKSRRSRHPLLLRLKQHLTPAASLLMSERARNHTYTFLTLILARPCFSINLMAGRRLVTSIETRGLHCSVRPQAA